MTKEELLAKISEKLGKTSLSERTLNSYVENIFKTVSDDSQINDVFLESHVGILKSVEGQLSHDIAEGLKNKPNEPTGPINPKPSPSDDSIKKILEMISEVKSENSKLRERLDNEKTLKDEQQYKQAVSDAVKGKGIKNVYILKQVMARKKFDVNKPVEEAVEETLKDYDAEYKDCFGSGGAPREVNNGLGDDEITKKSLDAFFEKKASEGKFPTQKN
jgi:hypothetical protein|nr:MAG TPA: hypothetical protein [Caudoviricetes sp.]